MFLYYEKLLQYLKDDNVEEALRYYEKWKSRGLLSEEEMKALAEILPDRARVVSKEALNRLFQKNQPFTQEEFHEMTEAVDQETKVRTKWDNINERWIKA